MTPFANPEVDALLHQPPPLTEAIPPAVLLSKEQESAWVSVTTRLRAKRRWWSGAALLALSLIAFVLVERLGSSTPLSLAVLVGVIALHEAGHWVAMRLLGWQDLRVFFIPFLGAAVSGRRAGAASWKEGVVSLAGPLPGLVLGLALAAVVRNEGSDLSRTTAAMLIGINAFNLLPLAALDGGTVLQLALFQRHRLLELAFMVLAAAGMALAAWKLEAPILCYVAFITLGSIPQRRRLLVAAQALRQRGLAVPATPAELEGEVGREVFRSAWDALPQTRHADGHLVAALGSLVDLVSRTLPTRRQTAGLLGAWALGLAAGAGGLWLLRHPALDWREVRDPGGRWVLQLPGEPRMTESATQVLQSTVTLRQVSWLSGNYAFLVFDLELPPGVNLNLKGWWDETTSSLVKAAKGQMVASGAADFQGRPGMAARLRQGQNAGRLAGFRDGDHGYLLMAFAPAEDEALDRFFDSVRLLAPTPRDQTR
jgi:Zn-dependent protease